MTQPNNDQDLEVFVGTMLLGMLKPLLDNGVPSVSAFRFVCVSLIENACGRAVFEELGIPERTWYRWLAEVRDHMADRPALADEPPAEFVAAVARLQEQFLADTTKKGNEK